MKITKERFDGAAEWRKLTSEEKAAIGAAAIESAMALLGILCLSEGEAFSGIATVERAYQQAHRLAGDQLLAIVNARAGLEGKLPMLPSVIGQVCRSCGCSEDDACDLSSGGVPHACSWVEPDLCSACVGRPEAKA
jgi:hypothetical protein